MTSGDPLESIARDTTRKLRRQAAVLDTLEKWVLDLNVPWWIIVLLVIVVVAPFILPPVKDWKTATTSERISVVIYSIAVAIVLLYFVA